jgi:hypothetical protein
MGRNWRIPSGIDNRPVMMLQIISTGKLEETIKVIWVERAVERKKREKYVDAPGQFQILRRTLEVS